MSHKVQLSRSFLPPCVRKIARKAPTIMMTLTSLYFVHRIYSSYHKDQDPSGSNVSTGAPLQKKKVVQKDKDEKKTAAVTKRQLPKLPPESSLDSQPHSPNTSTESLYQRDQGSGDDFTDEET